MGQGLLRIILYILLVTLPVWLAAWRSPEAGGIVNDVGRNFGLVGFMILLVQFLLAARVKWIERAFGLDILIRYHRYVAVAGTGFLVLHPLLLALGHGSWQLLTRFDLPWYIWAGKVALMLMVANVLVSIYQGRIGLKFEKWRLVHDLLAPTLLVLVFLHSWFAGDDLALPSMQLLWIAMLLLSSWMFVYHRFLRPARLRRQAYRVEDVHQETENVWTVKLVPPKGQTIEDYLPGQFHFMTFFRGRELPVEEHHWTISSSPAQKDFISSTIKAVGDFTSTIGQTRPGDTAAVHGPFGRYSYRLHSEERDLVFLAGGIGITPLMAMLRHMRDTKDNRSIMLLYANRRENQIVYRQELDQMAKGKSPDLTVVHFLSRPDEDWTGETGHVDGERIEKYCGQKLDQKVFYVCGPPQMAEGLIETLLKMGVSYRQIRREIFSFLD
jgi:predicted ferric reductase